MPIDDLSPVFSGTRTRTQVLSGVNNLDLATIRFTDTMKDTLVGCGWTLASSITATGFISYPFGAPWVSSGGSASPAVACTRNPFLKFAGVRFAPYNPFTETAPSGCGSGVAFFPWGTSGGDSVANIAAAITANTNYTGVAVSSGINITAKFAGADFNCPQVLGDGSWSPGGVVDGGGYTLSTPLGATSIHATFTTQKSNNGVYGPLDGQVQCTISSGDVSGSTTWFIDTLAEVQFTFTILANSYGFCFFDPRTDTHFLKSTSLLVQAPDVASGYNTVATLFLVAPRFFRNNTANWNACASAVGGPINTFSGNGAFPRVLVPRSPGTQPLTTLAGVPLVQGALVMLGGSYGDTDNVVGKLWDCIVVTDYIPSGGKLTLNGDQYEVISSQDGTGGLTRSSILWRYTN